MKKETINKIEALISKNKFDQVFALLKSTSLEREDRRAFIILSSRFEQLQQEFRKGLIGYEASNIEKNRIGNSILSLIKLEEKTDNLSNIKLLPNRRIFVILLLVIFFIVFLAYFNNTKTVGIQGDNNDNNEIIIKN